MISFVIACYNCEDFLRESVASALAQQDVEVEVLIIDDCSTDQSFQLAEKLAQEDRRVRCFRTAGNGGPAKARNIGLHEARGEWIAVLDADDLIHPERSLKMIHAAIAAGSQMVADNLVLFSGSDINGGTRFIDPSRFPLNDTITLESYLSSTVMYGPKPNLGFLKPVFSSAFLRKQSLAYDEYLMVGEDDDLVVRALTTGAKYTYLNEGCYYYRKHGQSISHRLTTHHADLMVQAAARFEPTMQSQPESVRKAWRKRRNSIRKAAVFAHMVAAVKAMDLGALARLAWHNPSALLLFRQPIAARIARWRERGGR